MAFLGLVRISTWCAASGPQLNVSLSLVGLSPKSLMFSPVRYVNAAVETSDQKKTRRTKKLIKNITVVRVE